MSASEANKRRIRRKKEIIINQDLGQIASNCPFYVVMCARTFRHVPAARRKTLRRFESVLITPNLVVTEERRRGKGSCGSFRGAFFNCFGGRWPVQVLQAKSSSACA